ncbi:hypothetical protein ACHAXM_001790, partial [Skeletonema potamos]
NPRRPRDNSTGITVKVKENTNQSPIKGRTPSAASGGSIESFETAVPDIVTSAVSKNNGLMGAFIKPLIDAWLRHGRTSDLSKWYIDGIMPRRRRDDESKEPTKSIPGLPYQWDSIVTLRGSPEEPPTEIGQKLAALSLHFPLLSSSPEASNSRVTLPRPLH